MSKYLSQNDVQINHLYIDSKGFELIYLGQATQNNGYWSYPLAYIYIKKEKLGQYPSSMSLNEILNDLEEKGVRHYCFSEKPRKMVKETEIDHRDEIHGKCGIFNFI